MKTLSAPAMARRIELWPIDRLVPYARNPRTHSEEQVIQIAASIVEFGYTSPILVDTKAGIIAGHGRLLAARKLGLAEVPVIVLDHLQVLSRSMHPRCRNQALRTPHNNSPKEMRPSPRISQQETSPSIPLR